MKAEFASMLDRCEAAGVPRQEARATLYFALFRENLAASIQATQDRATAAASSPVGQALQKCLELYLANHELKLLRISPDESEFKAACARYLRLAHNLGIGDTAEIHAWAKPRTIRITDFSLTFEDAEEPTDAFMWFSGEGIRNCPKKGIANHGCDLDTRIYKL